MKKATARFKTVRKKIIVTIIILPVRCAKQNKTPPPSKALTILINEERERNDT